MLNNKSLDAILSTFDKTLKDLEALCCRDRKLIDRNNANIEELRHANNNLHQEVDKAERVQARIREIIA
jgi:phosphoglycerate-specific signal transduction histidine kinase